MSLRELYEKPWAPARIDPFMLWKIDSSNAQSLASLSLCGGKTLFADGARMQFSIVKDGKQYISVAQCLAVDFAYLSHCLPQSLGSVSIGASTACLMRRYASGDMEV